MKTIELSKDTTDRITNELSGIIGSLRLIKRMIHGGSAIERIERARKKKEREEEELLRLVSDGKSIKQVARILDRSYQRTLQKIREAERHLEHRKNLPSTVTAQSSTNDVWLSVRTANCLNNANILTLGQLAATPEHVLRKIRNLGNVGIEEIRHALSRAGLSLRP